ncbi:hypothetical protein ES703_104548 [subsurface metagenome]
MPVITIPLVIHFWSNINNKAIGTMLTTAPAHMSSQATKCMLLKDDNATVITFVLSEEETIKGQKNSFHVHVNLIIIKTIRVGFIFGRDFR